MRHKVSVSIDEKICEKAHELGINISKVCENQLITLINAIQATNSKNSFLAPDSFTKEAGLVRLPGFEPGSSTWQAEVLNQARLQPLFHTFGCYTTLRILFKFFEWADFLLYTRRFFGIVVVGFGTCTSGNTN